MYALDIYAPVGTHFVQMYWQPFMLHLNVHVFSLTDIPPFSKLKPLYFQF